MQPGRTGRRAEILLMLGSLAAVPALLALVEVALRLWSPGYLFAIHGDESSNVYSETYGWQLRPGFQGYDLGDWVTVNADGYRGRLHAASAPAGRQRVVMLGDSIAYGAGVKDDATFSALLEKRGRFDVVNLAVGGYGSDQELIQLEHEAPRYHPAVVVLNFCLFSDFVDNALADALFDARQPKPHFTWNGTSLVLHADHLKLSPLRRASQWLVDESHLYNRLVSLVGRQRAPRQPGVWADRMSEVMNDLPAAAGLTFHLIRRMDELARTDGARFLVVIHPDAYAFRHVSKPLKKLCTAPLLEGIRVIEMGQRYRERGLDFAQVALDTPGHLTQLGHQVAAEVIGEALESPEAAERWDYRETCRSD